MYYICNNFKLFSFFIIVFKNKKNNIILMIRNVAQRADFSRIPLTPPLFRRAFYIVQFDFLFFFFSKRKCLWSSWCIFTFQAAALIRSKLLSKDEGLPDKFSLSGTQHLCHHRWQLYLQYFAWERYGVHLQTRNSWLWHIHGSANLYYLHLNTLDRQEI